MILQKFKISNELSKLFLIDILASELNISKKKAKSLLDSHSVFVNGRRLWIAKATLRPGDEVEIQRGPAEDSAENYWNQDFEILHQDEELIIVNKPAGIESIGAKGLEGKISPQLNLPATFACHRLDRDTSGCFILARTQTVADAMEAHFRSRAVNKVYLALVEGDVPERDFIVDQRLDGKEASTRFTQVARGRFGSLLEVKPISGRTHQIRRHLQTFGARLLGERRYLGKVRASAQQRQTKRQMLHAFKLDIPRLSDPSQRLKVTCYLPRDFIEAADLIGIKFESLKRFVATKKSAKKSR